MTGGRDADGAAPEGARGAAGCVVTGGPYMVGAYDRCGPLDERSGLDWPAALATVEEFAGRWPIRDAAIRACNTDRSDGDSDGLTDEEHDTIDEAEARGRALAVAATP